METKPARVLEECRQWKVVKPCKILSKVNERFFIMVLILAMLSILYFIALYSLADRFDAVFKFSHTLCHKRKECFRDYFWFSIDYFFQAKV